MPGRHTGIYCCSQMSVMTVYQSAGSWALPTGWKAGPGRRGLGGLGSSNQEEAQDFVTWVRLTWTQSGHIPCRLKNTWFLTVCSKVTFSTLRSKHSKCRELTLQKDPGLISGFCPCCSPCLGFPSSHSDLVNSYLLLTLNTNATSSLKLFLTACGRASLGPWAPPTLVNIHITHSVCFFSTLYVFLERIPSPVSLGMNSPWHMGEKRRRESKRQARTDLFP